jgi:hypothetical protein
VEKHAPSAEVEVVTASRYVYIDVQCCSFHLPAIIKSIAESMFLARLPILLSPLYPIYSSIIPHTTKILAFK